MSEPSIEKLEQALRTAIEALLRGKIIPVNGGLAWEWSDDLGGYKVVMLGPADQEPRDDPS